MAVNPITIGAADNPLADTLYTGFGKVNSNEAFLNSEISTEVTTRAAADTALDTGKADKPSSPTAGNLAGLDASGNLTDSSITSSSVSTVVANTSGTNTGDQDITGKADKKILAATGNVFVSDASGNLADGGQTLAQLAAKTISATPPSSPVDGQEWTDINSMITYTWYEDVDSNQWVQNLGDSVGLVVNPISGGWKDLVSPFSSAKGNGTTEPVWSDMGNGMYGMLFTAGDELFSSFHITHDYKSGTDCYPHIHWLCNIAMTVGDTVVWTISYVQAKGHNQADSLTDTPTDIVLTYTADGTEVAGEHMVTECSDVQAFPLVEVDGLVLMKVELTSVSVTGTEKIFGLMCDIHYETDGLETNEKAPNFTKST